MAVGQADTRPVAGPKVVSYEARLDADRSWAMNEGSRHFEKASAVHETLRRIAKQLDELGVPYAVAGGMALFEHGYRRFTEDVDILLTKEGLKRAHEALDGRGYVHKFAGSKNLRDTESGVQIEFLIAGQFPGDGKPKPIAFPSPESVSEIHDGIKFLTLNALIELKLASGLSGEDRAKDFIDVQELIKVLHLPSTLSEQLHPIVRVKYAELWAGTRKGKRYVTLWRNKPLASDSKSLDGMIATLQDAIGTLIAMRADGVTLDPEGGTHDDCARLVTTDPDVARKYGMEDEKEFWGDESEEGGKDE